MLHLKKIVPTVTAGARFFSSAIDPLSGNDHIIRSKQQILTNTFEQFVIHAFACMSLCTILDETSMKFIPTLVLVYCVARVLFMVGYNVHPLARGIGFALTFYPSAVTVVYLVHRFSFEWNLLERFVGVAGMRK